MDYSSIVSLVNVNYPSGKSEGQERVLSLAFWVVVIAIRHPAAYELEIRGAHDIGKYRESNLNVLQPRGPV